MSSTIDESFYKVGDLVPHCLQQMALPSGPFKSITKSPARVLKRETRALPTNTECILFYTHTFFKNLHILASKSSIKYKKATIG